MLAFPCSRLSVASRFSIGLCIALVCCFGLQALCYYVLDWKTGKGESNYFSTLGRFQAAAHPAAEIAFAGSSITGRLPGREAGNHRIANLGSDGGPALDGLRLINMGRIESPQWLIVEANTLYGGLSSADSLIINGARGTWFTVGSQIPMLGAMARPSAMLYAFLLRRPSVNREQAFPVTIDEVPEASESHPFVMSIAEKKRLDDYVRELETLTQRGTKLMIINFPAGVKKERDDWLMRVSISELAKRIAFDYVDLERQIPAHELQFTDSVHLAPSSAARIVATVESIIQSTDPK